LTCKDCGKKGHHVVEDRGQGEVKEKEWEELKKCKECSREERKKAVCPTKGKVQQHGARARDPEGIAREGGN